MQTSPRSSATRSASWPSCAASRRASSPPRWRPTRRASSAGDARVARVPHQPSLRRMLRFDVRPDRDLGQNFLIDSNILGVIERTAELGAEDVVLEIGGGPGQLPPTLSQRAPHAHPIEGSPRPRPALPDPLDPHPTEAQPWADAPT